MISICLPFQCQTGGEKCQPCIIVTSSSSSSETQSLMSCHHGEKKRTAMMIQRRRFCLGTMIRIDDGGGKGRMGPNSARAFRNGRCFARSIGTGDGDAAAAEKLQMKIASCNNFHGEVQITDARTTFLFSFFFPSI